MLVRLHTKARCQTKSVHFQSNTLKVSTFIDYHDGGLDEHICDDNDGNDEVRFDSLRESAHKYLAQAGALLVVLH